MNWDERLKEARARRAKIMESKRDETVEKGKTLFNPPTDDGDEKLEKLRLAARGELRRDVKRAPLPVKSRRAGLVPLVFGIGILLGVGFTQFQSLMPSSTPTLPDEIASESSLPITPPADPAPVPTPVPTPVPAPSNQAVAEVSVPPLVISQISVLPMVDPAISTAPSGGLQNALIWSAPARIARPEFAVASAIDAVPDVGGPPERAPLVATPPPETIAIERLETVALLRSVNADDPTTGVDIRPITRITRTRSLPPLADVSLSNIVPLSLDTSTAPALEQTPVETTPQPLTPEAIARPIWIFAPSSVGQDVINTSQSVAEQLNLSVQAVNRVGYRISQSQVRYYDRDSAEAAARLAAEIGAIPRDFTTSDVNAAPGTLEIYLAGRSTVARAQTTAPRRAQPSNDLDRLRSSVIDRIRAGLSN